MSTTADVSPGVTRARAPGRPGSSRPSVARAPEDERLWVIGLVVVLVVAGVAVAVTKPFATGRAQPPGRGRQRRSDGPSDGDPPGPVRRRPQVSATLGYAGSYSVVNQAQGTVTSLPAVGQVVEPRPGPLPR